MSKAVYTGGVCGGVIRHRYWQNLQHLCGLPIVDLLDRSALGALGIVAEVAAIFILSGDVPARPTEKAALSYGLHLTPIAKQVLQESGKPILPGKHIVANQLLARLPALNPPDHVPSSFMRER